MKPLGGHKARKGSKLTSSHTKSLNSGTVMLASAIFFFLGWLKGTVMPPHADSGKMAAVTITLPSENAAQQQQQQQQQQGEKARVVLEQAAPVGQVVELPHLPAFNHGETGQGEVEHISFQQLSWKPRAYIFPGFADAERCDKIVAYANISMFPSTLALRAGEDPNAQKNVRTSTGSYISGSDEPSGSLAWVEQKMARITAVPVAQGEAFNILRYVHGQHYEAHMDTFDPKDFGPQRTNRIASFLLYLTDVEEGGETVFPQEDGKVRTQRFNECVGLKVKPRKGDALLFWSMTPERTIDANALHAGCDVIKGEKWVATKWIRDG